MKDLIKLTKKAKEILEKHDLLKLEDIIEKDYGENGLVTDFNKNYQFNPSSPCDQCPNNPKNGGSGICHCTLGNTIKWTC